MSVRTESPAPGQGKPYPNQRRAAAPDTSVWVEASAGSGKTKVLADRVIRLMLTGTSPERILCLTFTRAAAAQMSNRINEILGGWAAADDADLQGQIEDLTGAAPDEETCFRARRLFAEVLDVPGGMKVQTIHAFCESLLGRFPLEAGIAPHFEVMDERTSAELMQEARDDVLEAAATDVDGPLSAALAEVTHRVGEQGFTDLIEQVSRERGRLQRLLASDDGPDGYRRRVYRLLGVKEGEDERDVVKSACADSAFDAKGLKQAAAALEAGKKTDTGRARAISVWLAHTPEQRCAGFDVYRSAFLTNDGEPQKRLITKDVAADAPDTVNILVTEANRLATVQQRRNAAVIAGASDALVRLAAAILDAYQAHKARHARLDYDDLILLARRLLETGGSASWVLYKLDGGIDHILIDEAQDTNPDQWAIVRAIADEFFAGLGSREASRTVFAVGDAKQSIFSFQRADPDEFLRMNRYFAERVVGAEAHWDEIDLDVSFRSTPAVLAAVDNVFDDTEASDGLGDALVRHRPHRSRQSGLVELWPTVVPEPAADLLAWAPPVIHTEDLDDPPVRLAKAIAGRIGRWLDEEEHLASHGRPIRPGDILILVQRRTGFVDDLVRELKSRNIDVAGVDRLVLSDHLAVMDVVALGQFLLLPEDDLTLATVLKGPFIGFDEQALFDVAHDRGKQSLWQALRRRAHSDPRARSAHELLTELLSRVDYETPYALFADLLGARGGRTRIVARLGEDANDPLDEFQALALAFERSHPPTLQGFLHWFARGQTEIKRDLEQGDKGEVRIMTVHGAKGLQAPIVFLADTVRTPAQAGSVQTQLLWQAGDEQASHTMVWRPRAEFREPLTSGLVDDVRKRRDQEYRRLLYVAMTRAEDRLYVCGYETRRKPSDACWYRMVERGLAKIATACPIDLTHDVGHPTGWLGDGWRLTSPQDGDPDKHDLEPGPSASTSPLPAWAAEPAPAEADPPMPLSPSRPDDDEPPVLSPLGADAGRRFARGNLIHDLLQFLPEVASDARMDAARQFLARSVHGLTPDQQEEIAHEAVVVMETPEFADIFGPDARAEVPLVGRVGKTIVSGRVDRLVVSNRDVLIVDYKSNRPPPRHVDDVAVIYLRQLAAYRAVLSEIYPEFSVSCALLWTDGPCLMPIPGRLLETYAP